MELETFGDVLRAATEIYCSLMNIKNPTITLYIDGKEICRIKGELTE